MKKNLYIAAIERRMNRLRAPITETFRDPASGRSETITKGEWQGSIFEFELFSSLLKEFQEIAKDANESWIPGRLGTACRTIKADK